MSDAAAKPSRAGRWLGTVALAALLGFSWLPQSYYCMVSWPWLALWQLGFAAAMLALLVMLRQFRVPFQRLGYGLDWAVGVIAVALALTTGLAAFPGVAAWNVALALSYGVLLYGGCNWLRQSQLSVQRLGIGIVTAGAISALIAFAVSLANQNGLQLDGLSPFSNPNFAAGYFVLLLPLSLAAAVTASGRARVLGVLGSALLAAALYTTGSRGGLLGLGVLLVAAVAIAIRRSRGRQRQRWLAGAAAALVALLGVAASNPAIRGWIYHPQDAGPRWELRLDRSSQNRLYMWQAGLNIARDRPLAGVGPGNLSRTYNRYRPVAAGLENYSVQQLHNMPLQLLAELGGLGLGAYAGLLGTLMRLGWRLDRALRHHRDRVWLYGAGGGLFAYTVASLTDYQLESIRISGALLALVVLLVGLADRHLGSPASLALLQRQRRWLTSAALRPCCWSCCLSGGRPVRPCT